MSGGAHLRAFHSPENVPYFDDWWLDVYVCVYIYIS